MFVFPRVHHQLMLLIHPRQLIQPLLSRLQVYQILVMHANSRDLRQPLVWIVSSHSRSLKFN